MLLPFVVAAHYDVNMGITENIGPVVKGTDLIGFSSDGACSAVADASNTGLSLDPVTPATSLDFSAVAATTSMTLCVGNRPENAVEFQHPDVTVVVQRAVSFDVNGQAIASTSFAVGQGTYDVLPVLNPGLSVGDVLSFVVDGTPCDAGATVDSTGAVPFLGPDPTFDFSPVTEGKTLLLCIMHATDGVWQQFSDVQVGVIGPGNMFLTGVLGGGPHDCGVDAMVPKASVPVRMEMASGLHQAGDMMQ